MKSRYRHPEGMPKVDGPIVKSKDDWIQGEVNLSFTNIPDGEVHRIISETGGEKDQKPLQLHGIPWEALSELGRVYAFGATEKPEPYGDYNFRKGYAWSLTYDAMQRHMGMFWNREDNDTESGLHHMAHAIWHGFTLLFFSLTERGTDDRPS